MSFPHNGEAVPVHQADFFTMLKKQFFYKVHAHYSMFSTMVMMQLIGLIFSIGGENYGIGTSHIELDMKVSSGSIVIAFTFFWIFIMAMMMTMRPAKSMMYTFITNKRINHLSNLLFIVFLSMIGGVSSYLLGFFIKLVTFLLYGSENILFVERVMLKEAILGIAVTILYMLLISSIGYFLGEIFSLHKIFIVVIPVVFAGFLIVFHESMIEPLFSFFTEENHFIIFTIRVLFVVSILFLIAFQLDRRSEVS